jgi:hypothetical protein
MFWGAETRTCCARRCVCICLCCGPSHSLWSVCFIVSKETGALQWIGCKQGTWFFKTLSWYSPQNSNWVSSECKDRVLPHGQCNQQGSFARTCINMPCTSLTETLNNSLFICSVEWDQNAYFKLEICLHYLKALSSALTGWERWSIEQSQGNMPEDRNFKRILPSRYCVLMN